MRLRDEWKQPVDRASAWLAIGFVVLLLGAMGVTEIATGQAPTIPRPGMIALVAWVVGVNAYRVLRYGRRALPLPDAAVLVGFLAFAAGELAGKSTAAWRWIGDAGCLLLLVGMLSQMVTLGRRRGGAPSAT